MPIRGRHERDYFKAAIEVVPPTLQAIAALAISFALTFAGHRFVPDWSVGVTPRRWRRNALRSQPLGVARPPPSSRPASQRPWAHRGKSICSRLTMVVTGCAVKHQIAHRPIHFPRHRWIDAHPELCLAHMTEQIPGTSPCVHSAHPILDQGQPALHDMAGRPVGYVQLVRSVACAIVWARVILGHSSAVRLKGDIALITMVRPGDNAKAVYALLLHGGTIGFGNMLSDSQSCVIAQVAITTGKGGHTGPETVTGCR